MDKQKFRKAKKFSKDLLRCLEGSLEYLRFLAVKKSKTEKYLVVKGSYGLGNRIFFLLSAMVYARLNKRTLVVDWRDKCYSSKNENAYDFFSHCRRFFSPKVFFLKRRFNRLIGKETLKKVPMNHINPFRLAVIGF